MSFHVIFQEMLAATTTVMDAFNTELEAANKKMLEYEKEAVEERARRRISDEKCNSVEQKLANLNSERAAKTLRYENLDMAHNKV